MTDRDELRTVRILISSPGDVDAERDRARQVIESLRRRYARRFQLKPVLWEDFPLQSDMPFQQGIDLVLSEESGIDIAVFLLWSRLGSAVGNHVLRPDGTEYRSGTEREIDLMLEARTQNHGLRPVILVYLRDDETSFEERLRGKPTQIKEQLIEQKKLVEQFITEEFEDKKSGHNMRAFHTYDRPVTFSNRFRVHLISLLDELAGEMSEAIWDILKQGPPFLGLNSFQPEHADVFFGREEEALEARFALREQAREGCAFLLLTGASGSGKSSLARAGILPEIIHNELDDEVVAWRWLIATPAELTPDPVLALLRRLSENDVLPELKDDAVDLETLARDLCENPELTFRHVFKPVFHRRSGGIRLLLVIDQLEEIFVSNLMTGKRRAEFLKLLETFARSGQIWILATARNDFYHLIQAEPVLAQLLEVRGTMPVQIPSPDALRRVIEEPARLAGLKFEERDGISLASRILRDAAAHAELLPLVEFVLRELYEGCASDGLLTFSAYEQLGGVEGAVGKKSEETFLSLTAPAQAALAEILPLLISVEVSGEHSAVRRRARLNDLRSTPAQQELTDSLIENRFLITDRQDDTAVASFAHEALLRRWSRITSWIELNRERLRWRAQVEECEHRWEQRGRDASLLLPAGLQLEEGRQLLKHSSNLLSQGTTKYIQTSIAVEKAKLTSKRRFRNLIWAIFCVLTGVACLIGGWAYWEYIDNIDERLKAKIAEAKERSTRKKLYTVRMNLAESEWDRPRVGKVRELLNENVPGTDSDDVCGFEWFYWDRLCHRDLDTFLGHKDDVSGVAFSPDGTRLVSASSDETLKLWDVATGQELKTFAGHLGPIHSVAFSPDGCCIASAGFDHTVKLWNVVTGALKWTVEGNSGPVMDITFSPDGQQIAAANQQSTVDILDAATGKQIRTLLAHTARVNSVVFSPDQAWIASAGSDMSIKLWNAATGVEERTLTGHAHSVNCIAFSPDGSRIVSGSSDKTIRFWDVTTGQATLTVKPNEHVARSIVFSPDGARVASAGSDQTVKLWDAKTGRELQTLKGHSGWVNDVVFSQDGMRIASGSSDQTLKLWDVVTGEKMRTIKADSAPVNCVVFHPDQSTIASTTSNLTIKVWNAKTLHETHSLKGHTSAITCLAANKEKDWLASAGKDRTIRIWNVSSGKEIRILEGHADSVNGVAFSPDGSQLASASDDQTVKIWDTATGKVLKTLNAHDSRVNSVAFHPKGKSIASADNDGTVLLWNLSSGKETRLQKIHAAPIRSVAFSPDGEKLASAGHDGTVSLWDLTTGREALSLKGHADWVHCVTFDPMGKRIASASNDGFVKLWDSETGQETLSLKAHPDGATSLSFNADSNRIASAGNDGTVKLWDAQPVSAALRIQQQAICLVHGLLPKVKSLDALSEAITKNQTFKPQVLERAKEFAPELWQKHATSRENRDQR